MLLSLAIRGPANLLTVEASTKVFTAGAGIKSRQGAALSWREKWLVIIVQATLSCFVYFLVWTRLFTPSFVKGDVPYTSVYTCVQVYGWPLRLFEGLLGGFKLIGAICLQGMCWWKNLSYRFPKPMSQRPRCIIICNWEIKKEVKEQES